MGKSCLTGSSIGPATAGRVSAILRSRVRRRGPLTANVKPPMKRHLTIALIGAALCISALLSYQLGLRAGSMHAKEDLGAVLASVQADLGLSKLQRLRELEADLARACTKEALAKVRFDIDTQMYVLASLYRDHKGTWVMDQVFNRDPSMATQLEGFKQQYGSWTEPKCGA